MSHTYRECVCVRVCEGMREGGMDGLVCHAHTEKEIESVCEGMREGGRGDGPGGQF